jgi:NAD(P)-dependent dehydrogenase (short-subunit alcohol dehydrogenase family)
VASGGVALVTGAGSGVGKATATALARAGFTVVLAGRRQAPLDAVTAEIAAAGGTGRAIPVDVTDSRSIETLYAEIEARLGRLDLLFNNAGVVAPNVPFDELTDEDWQSVVSTNLLGAALCARGAFRLMKRQRPQGGRIINNGSISAYVPRPNSAPYTSTKHGVTGLTRSIALDGRPFDIACGQLDIGNATTDMSAYSAVGALQADGTVRPEPRMDVNEAARAVVHMASLPLSANVLFMTVMATKMPFVGRG